MIADNFLQIITNATTKKGVIICEFVGSYEGRFNGSCRRCYDLHDFQRQRSPEKKNQAQHRKGYQGNGRGH